MIYVIGFLVCLVIIVSTYGYLEITFWHRLLAKEIKNAKKSPRLFDGKWSRRQEVIVQRLAEILDVDEEIIFDHTEYSNIGKSHIVICGQEFWLSLDEADLLMRSQGVMSLGGVYEIKTRQDIADCIFGATRK